MPTRSRIPLPIDDAIPAIVSAVDQHGAVILRAPPGAGKTTRVPPALLEHGLADGGLVLMLEPRRVAARAAARRMALEDGSALGETFGYQVRFDKKSGPKTRVMVVTPGVLLRRLHDDPYLEHVSAVIFDEFHERGLEADLALGMVRLIRETLRPELRVVIMSATIDPTAASAYFGGCPVVDSAGRTFPVEVNYRNRRSTTPLHESVREAAIDLFDTTNGDLLVFLPGVREIRQTAEEFDHLAAERGIEVLPLHGELAADEQDRALRKLERRKIVLATNVAETSVTVEGVTAVIDSGLARQMEFEPSVGMDRLRLVPVSRASCDQRAGRAGRTAPGVCVRLWDEPSHRARPEQTLPEIRRVDLAGAMLQLAGLGETDFLRFPWLDPPLPESVERSRRLLEHLGFFDGTALNELGRMAATLPVHPRLARLLIEGKRQGVEKRAALAAALLSERDPFVRDHEAGSANRTAPATRSDMLDRVEALEAFEHHKLIDGPLGRLHRGSASGILEVRDQLLRTIGLLKPDRDRVGNEDEDDRLLRCIFTAYSDRLARRREKRGPKALTIDGRGVRLTPNSGVVEAELFVCVDVDLGSGPDAFVRSASEVETAWLPQDRIRTAIEVEFDEKNEKLQARKVTRFDDLILDETNSHIPDSDEAAVVLARAAAARLDRVLPTPDSAAGQFRTRVRCLQAWLPELELPALAEEDLLEHLGELCRGKRSLTDVRTGPWLEFFRGRLIYEQLRILDAEAPETIEVPSGSRIAIEYAEGKPPVLAVRIQELFGLAETPRLARGRVALLLHLLAPNHRPQQITDDLGRFWKHGYPIVRKELRGRYPKHSWPDDPLTAEAIRGAKRRPVD